MIRTVLLAATLGALSATSAAACQLKLLLSWDVSSSMDAHEFEKQRRGTADAFRHPSVQNVVALSPGGVAVSLIQWAGPNQQAVSVPWVILRSNRDVRDFAGRIDAVEAAFCGRSGSAIGDGLVFAARHLALGPQGCGRSVIDISGDGATNIGAHPAQVSDALAQAGVTINGLVIHANHDKIKSDDPYMHYVRNVSRGPSAFVMEAASYEQFPRAMRRKLLRALTDQTAALQ